MSSQAFADHHAVSQATAWLMIKSRENAKPPSDLQDVVNQMRDVEKMSATVGKYLEDKMTSQSKALKAGVSEKEVFICHYCGKKFPAKGGAADKLSAMLKHEEHELEHELEKDKKERKEGGIHIGIRPIVESIMYTRKEIENFRTAIQEVAAAASLKHRWVADWQKNKKWSEATTNASTTNTDDDWSDAIDGLTKQPDDGWSDAIRTVEIEQDTVRIVIPEPAEITIDEPDEEDSPGLPIEIHIGPPPPLPIIILPSSPRLNINRTKYPDSELPVEPEISGGECIYRPGPHGIDPRCPFTKNGK